MKDRVVRATHAKEGAALARRPKPLASIVPVEDVERLKATADQADLEEAKKALREFEKTGERTVGLEEVARRWRITIPKGKQ